MISTKAKQQQIDNKKPMKKGHTQASSPDSQHAARNRIDDEDEDEDEDEVP